MKNLFYVLFTVFALAIAPKAYAGGGPCVIDTTTCVPGGFLYGEVCPGNIPGATAGQLYNQTVSFTLPSSFDLNTDSLGLGFGTITVSVTDVDVQLVGLPSGLVVNFDDNDRSYNPQNQPAGCFQIFGVPCDYTDTFQVALQLNVTVNVPILGSFAVPFPLVTNLPLALQSSYPRLEITSTGNFLCTSGPGSSLTLRASAGFGAYVWTPGSSLDDSLVVAAPGEYFVEAITTDNQCSFSDSVTIDYVNAQVTGDTTLCTGHFLQLNATGGDSFTWSPSTALSSTTVANPVILRSFANTTTYQVIASNGFCSDTAAVTVTANTNCGGACGNCTVNSNGCGGPLPTVCNVLPVVTAGQAYDESFTFFIPDSIRIADVLPIPITIPGLPEAFVANEVFVRIDSLPAGLDWSCDQQGNNCTYNPTLDPSAQYGCIRICGTTCGPAGEYLTAEVGIKLPQQLRDIIASIPFPLGIDSIVFIPFDINLGVEYTSNLSILTSGDPEILEGDTLALTASAGFTGYEWSTGATTAEINVSEADTYCVTATDANGCEQTSCQEVTVLSSVTDLVMDASLKIYPNPSKGQFAISFNSAQAQTVAVSIVDLAGKTVYQNTLNANGGNNELTVNLSQAAQGIYFVKLSSEKGTAIRKVTLN
ncbi:MAG: T9SS type A sorting domain-containing protein [Chitinophagales bacterium]|nr:T9SS type A sorting domain-containing protein [Chitinophagales bacterium]